MLYPVELRARKARRARDCIQYKPRARGVQGSRSRGRLLAPVLPLIILAILPAPYLLHPRLVLLIPLDRLPKPFLELHLRLPAQLALDLRAIDGVTPIVAETV